MMRWIGFLAWTLLAFAHMGTAQEPRPPPLPPISTALVINITINNGTDQLTGCNYSCPDNCNLREALRLAEDPSSPLFYAAHGNVTLRIQFHPNVTVCGFHQQLQPATGFNLELIGRGTEAARAAPLLTRVGTGDRRMLVSLHTNISISIRGLEIAGFRALHGAVVGLTLLTAVDDHVIIDIRDCYIHDNIAWWYGAVVSTIGNYVVGDVYVTMQGNLFDENSVRMSSFLYQNFGGTILFLWQFDRMHVVTRNCTFSNVDVYAPSFNLQGKIHRIYGGVFSLNSVAFQAQRENAINVVVEDCLFTDIRVSSIQIPANNKALATIYGGLIHAECRQAVTHCQVRLAMNRVRVQRVIVTTTGHYHGGVVARTLMAGHVSMRNVSVVDNQVGAPGIPINVLATVRFHRSLFLNMHHNVFVNPLLYEMSLHVEDCAFVDNYMHGRVTVEGGFLRVFSGLNGRPTIRMIRVNVTDNWFGSPSEDLQTLMGGALFLKGILDNGFVVDMEHMIMADNVHYGLRVQGALVHLDGAHSVVLSLERNTIVRNAARGSGRVQGLFFISIIGEGSIASLNNRWQDNTLSVASLGSFLGGVFALLIASLDVTFDQDQFIGNHGLAGVPKGRGGVLVVVDAQDISRQAAGAVVFRDCTVQYNQMQGFFPLGGLVTVAGGVDDVSLSLDGGIFQDNELIHSLLQQTDSASLLYSEATSQLHLGNGAVLRNNTFTNWESAAFGFVNGSMIHLRVPPQVGVWSVEIMDVVLGGQADDHDPGDAAVAAIFIDAEWATPGSGLLSLVEIEASQWDAATDGIKCLHVSHPDRVAETASCADDVCPSTGGCSPNDQGPSFGISCKPCAPRTGISDNGICELCTAGKYLPINSTDGICLQCEPGSFTIAPGGSACSPCPGRGASCADGSLVAIDGFWVPLGAQNITDDLVKVYECLTSACVGQNQCGDNRLPFAENPLCRECLPNYVDMGGVCVECRSVNGWLVASIGVMFVLYVIGLHAVSQTASGVARVFVFGVQTSLVMISSTSAAGLQWLEAFNSPVLAVRTCVGPFSPYYRLAFGSLTPVISIMILSVMGAVERCRKGPAAFQMKPYWRTLMALGFFSYTQLLLVATRALRCTDVRTGTDTVERFITTIPSINCDDKAYQAWRVLFMVIVAVCVAVPFVLWWFLHRQREHIRAVLRQGQVGRFGPWFGYAYEPFRSSQYYWQSVIVIKRLAFILVDLVLASRPEDRGFSFQVLILASVAFHAYHMPYRLVIENQLETFVHMMLLLQSGILIGRSPPYDAHVINLAGLFTLTPILVVAVFWLVIKVFDAYRSRSTKLDEVQGTDEAPKPHTNKIRRVLSDMMMLTEVSISRKPAHRTFIETIIDDDDDDDDDAVHGGTGESVGDKDKKPVELSALFQGPDSST